MPVSGIEIMGRIWYKAPRLEAFNAYQVFIVNDFNVIHTCIDTAPRVPELRPGWVMGYMEA